MFDVRLIVTVGSLFLDRRVLLFARVFERRPVVFRYFPRGMLEQVSIPMLYRNVT